MAKATPISLDDAFATLVFLGDRTPETTPEEKGGAFAALSDYRDGAVFIAHYAGDSEWERHPRGDEIVLVVEGETTLFLWIDGEQVSSKLRRGQLFVVPRNAWHRFESPGGVKILTVTPQPTEHRITPPEQA
jgi:mannose-6-phosphate isomerase-like protein (cupin superfamily)